MKRSCWLIWRHSAGSSSKTGIRMQELLGITGAPFDFHEVLIFIKIPHTHTLDTPRFYLAIRVVLLTKSMESVPRCEYISASTKTFGCAQCSILVGLSNSKANHWLFMIFWDFSYVQISHALRRWGHFWKTLEVHVQPSKARLKVPSKQGSFGFQVFSMEKGSHDGWAWNQLKSTWKFTVSSWKACKDLIKWLYTYRV